MTVNELCNLLNEWAPQATAESWDNVGLLVGDALQKVSGIMITHDLTAAVVDEAVAKDCNFIISFHPILFTGTKRLVEQDLSEQRVRKLIKNEVSLYSIHTALDNHKFGVNFGMMRALGIAHSEILVPKRDFFFKVDTYVPKSHLDQVRDAMFAAGAGKLAEYSECAFVVEGEGSFKSSSNAKPYVGTKNERHYEKESKLGVIFPSHLKNKVINTLRTTHPYEEVAFELYKTEQEFTDLGMGRIGELEDPMSEVDFLTHVKETFQTPTIRHSALNNKPVKKVAVLGGSGSSVIDAALRKKADVLITADLKYHDFYKANNKIILIDVGHFESEMHTRNIIQEFLCKKIPNFAILVSQTKTNPVNYF